MIRSILAFAFLVSLAVPALAAPAASEDITVDQLAKICGQKELRLSQCRAIYSARAELLTAKQHRQMVKTIESSTDSWGDSIFEGDVDSNQEDLQFESRPLIERASGNLLGYKVRFSYAGWETSCAGDDYDRKKPETFKNCKLGRIFQTIVVSPDLKSYDILEDAELVLDR